MGFAWEDTKSRRNLAKHRVSFETARLVFDDPRAISRLDRVEDGEERWQTLGLAGGIVVLLCAYLPRGGRRRGDPDYFRPKGNAPRKEHL